jgi:hypothetical protein
LRYLRMELEETKASEFLFYSLLLALVCNPPLRTSCHRSSVESNAYVESVEMFVKVNRSDSRSRLNCSAPVSSSSSSGGTVQIVHEFTFDFVQHHGHHHNQLRLDSCSSPGLCRVHLSSSFRYPFMIAGSVLHGGYSASYLLEADHKPFSLNGCIALAEGPSAKHIRHQSQ